jgi:hypothetical protein
MKEIVISLLEDNEKARVQTSSLVRDALKSLVDNKIIDISTREKYNYTKQELTDVTATFAIKLVDCNEKFRGAFMSWFAYNTAPCREVEPNEFHFSRVYFDVILSRIREITCFLHRVNGMTNEGFDGKILLKIYDFKTFKDKEEFEVEPLTKHAKYFNEFAELNPNDF